MSMMSLEGEQSCAHGLCDIHASTPVSFLAFVWREEHTLLYQALASGLWGGTARTQAHPLIFILKFAGLSSLEKSG